MHAFADELWQRVYEYLDDADVARAAMACHVASAALQAYPRRAAAIRRRRELLAAIHVRVIELIGGAAKAARLPLMERDREAVAANDLDAPITLGFDPIDASPYVAICPPSRTYVDVLYRYDEGDGAAAVQWRCLSDGGVMFHNHGQLIRADGTMDSDVHFILRLVLNHACG